MLVTAICMTFYVLFLQHSLSVKCIRVVTIQVVSGIGEINLDATSGFENISASWFSVEIHKILT